MKTLLESQMEKLSLQIDEIHGRTRRMETGMHKMRESMGVEVERTIPLVTVANSSMVDVAGYDVPLGHIKRALEHAGKFDTGIDVSVWCKEKRLATVMFHD